MIFSIREKIIFCSDTLDLQKHATYETASDCQPEFISDASALGRAQWKANDRSASLL